MHVDELDLEFECNQNWNDIETDGSPVGHCGQCDKSVVNLSMLTETEARELLDSVDRIPDPSDLTIGDEPTAEIGRTVGY